MLFFAALVMTPFCKLPSLSSAAPAERSLAVGDGQMRTLAHLR
jgi:hypothetical protein